MTSVISEAPADAPSRHSQAPIDPGASGLSAGQMVLAAVVVAGSLIAGHAIATALMPAIEAKKLSWVEGSGSRRF